MELWDHKLKIYIGPVDLKKMDREIRKGYYIAKDQQRRQGIEYTVRAFLYWWYFNSLRKQLKSPHVGRLDHSKPYSFKNIQIEEAADNIRERNFRRGNPCNTHKKVIVTYPNGKKEVFNSKRDVARKFNINEKTVYNRCSGKTVLKNNGPKTMARDLEFSWSK